MRLSDFKEGFFIATKNEVDECFTEIEGCTAACPLIVGCLRQRVPVIKLDFVNGKG